MAVGLKFFGSIAEGFSKLRFQCFGRRCREALELGLRDNVTTSTDLLQDPVSFDLPIRGLTRSNSPVVFMTLFSSNGILVGSCFHGNPIVGHKVYAKAYGALFCRVFVGSVSVSRPYILKLKSFKCPKALWALGHWATDYTRSGACSVNSSWRSRRIGMDPSGLQTLNPKAVALRQKHGYTVRMQSLTVNVLEG